MSPGLLQDKRMEMDKHGLGVGDYNRVVGKGPGSRPQIPKESSMDRSPYFDKVSWGHWGHCWAPHSACPGVTCVLLSLVQVLGGWGLAGSPGHRSVLFTSLTHCTKHFL